MNNPQRRKYFGCIRAVEFISLPFVNDLGEDREVAMKVYTVPIYKETESREAQMESHGQVKSAVEEASERKWRGDVKVVEEYSKCGQRFIKMLEEFKTMRDGYIERINAAKHRIEPEPSGQRLI